VYRTGARPRQQDQADADEEPMADVQKWIDKLRAGKVVGRIVLKN
jgi:hypothetical protein